MRGERIDLRVTNTEKRSWFAAAVAEDVKLADWIRARCNAYLAEQPSPEQCEKNLAADKELAERFPVGGTIKITMPQRAYLARPEHDKTCQCGICDFRRKTLSP